MKGERQLKIRIRRILFPILFCLAVACLIELPLAQTMPVQGRCDPVGYTVRAIVAVPMLVHLYRGFGVPGERTLERKNRGSSIFLAVQEYPWHSAFAVKTLQIPGAVLADESLFTEISGWRLWCFWRHPCSGGILFRGVLYGRCKELVSPGSSIYDCGHFPVCSTGILCRGIYEEASLWADLAYLGKDTVKAPVVFHFMADLAALVLAVL